MFAQLSPCILLSGSVRRTTVYRHNSTKNRWSVSSIILMWSASLGLRSEYFWYDDWLIQPRASQYARLPWNNLSTPERRPLTSLKANWEMRAEDLLALALRNKLSLGFRWSALVWATWPQNAMFVISITNYQNPRTIRCRKSSVPS